MGSAIIETTSRYFFTQPPIISNQLLCNRHLLDLLRGGQTQGQEVANQTPGPAAIVLIITKSFWRRSQDIKN